VFLVKREESKDFDVFLEFFGCLEERKKCVERLGRRKILEKSVFSLVWGCLGLFIALGANFKAAALGGLPTSKGLKKYGFG